MSMRRGDGRSSAWWAVVSVAAGLAVMAPAGSAGQAVTASPRGNDPINARSMKLLMRATPVGPVRLVPTVVTGNSRGSVAGPLKAAPSALTDPSAGCPQPQSLVKRARWSSHRLAPGVTLREATAHDRTVGGGHGQVSMHVLRIDTAALNLHFAPLLRSWAQRSPLSSLAAGHPHLVAATNTGYYDFFSGAPYGPVVVDGGPKSLGAQQEPVIAMTPDGRVEPGTVALIGKVEAAGQTQQVSGLDDLSAKRGLAIWNHRWGMTAVNFSPADATANLGAVIRNGTVVSVAGGTSVPPTVGQLLVASTPSARAWLSRLRVGEHVSESLHVRAVARRPMTEAFAVSQQIVAAPGKVDTDLGCVERDPQAARTAVGFADHGKEMLIVVVADHPETSLHGLSHEQLSRVMVDLGADKAWEWDGSGSSEMIARMPATGLLSIRNYCADGAERPMPVGFGIFSNTRHKRNARSTSANK